MLLLQKLHGPEIQKRSALQLSAAQDQKALDCWYPGRKKSPLLSPPARAAAAVLKK